VLRPECLGSNKLKYMCENETKLEYNIIQCIILDVFIYLGTGFECDEQKKFNKSQIICTEKSQCMNLKVYADAWMLTIE